MLEKSPNFLNILWQKKLGKKKRIRRDQGKSKEVFDGLYSPVQNYIQMTKLIQQILLFFYSILLKQKLKTKRPEDPIIKKLL